MGRLLALETSCDETAVCILEGNGHVMSEAIHSQIAQHRLTGGVVPEVASRSHLEVIPELVLRSLRAAELGMSQIDAFAATNGPGLGPALLVGVNVARGMAMGAGRPFIPVNHLEGHLLSPFFGEETIPAHTALVVSGGHTILFGVEGFRRYTVLGQTRDDAAGEAFDKVAKLLGLPYPGGVEIDRIAKEGDAGRYPFPRGLLHEGLDFSFSGLKTAVRIFLEREAPGWRLADVCASFQDAVVDVLVRKLLRAARERGDRLVSISGGVSSNSRLASLAHDRCHEAGIALRLADPALRTDNARMIAFVASLGLQCGSDCRPEDISPSFQPDAFPDS